MKKKGQAAMEFLMTYGWSLLIVLVAVGGLGYFGVQKFSTQKPNICLTEQPFSCIDAGTTENDLKFVLINNGLDVVNLNVTLVPPNNVRVQCDFISKLSSAHQQIVTCPITFTAGYHQSDIDFTYNTRSTLTKHKQGSVSVNVD